MADSDRDRIPKRIDEDEAPSLDDDDVDKGRGESLANDGGNSPSLEPRSANRLRRWHVTFGNPALGTYSGSIVTVHRRVRRSRRLSLGEEFASERSSDGDCREDEVEGDDDDATDDDSSSSPSDVSFSSCSSLGSFSRGESPESGGKGGRRIAAMVDVPPHQVPDGVLNLVRGHRPFIEHIRIVIGSSCPGAAERPRRRRGSKVLGGGYSNEGSRESSPRRRSQTWACENDAYLATALGAAAPNSDDLEAFQMRSRESRVNSLDDSPHRPYDSGIERRSDGFEVAVGEEKYESANGGDDGNKKYHILFVLDSEDSVDTFVSDLHHRPYTFLDESETCSVYHTASVKGEDGVSLLGPLFASPSSTTPSSNETVAPSTKDEHQCPVCLDALFPQLPLPGSSQDASSSIFTTVCNHSFHIDCLARWQDSPCPVCRYDHSGLNEALSRCHVCETTVKNYVCLICGVISCATGPSASSMTPQTSHDAGATVSQAPTHLGHALQHYEESLHAYALDTETQHVWDFAGGGYVHRLLQNSEDGKIVEGTDPRLMEEQVQGLNQIYDEDGLRSPLSALERSAVPTYPSSAEDDEAMHRKLEGFAGQYYTLLKSQLEQQRIFYEGRLEAMRRENESANKNSQRRTASDLISALKQERNQLEQRCATLRRKYKKASDDAVFLENMNESLLADRHAFKKQITDSQAELAEAKKLTQQLLNPLEEKVSSLMLQLDNGLGR